MEINDEVMERTNQIQEELHNLATISLKKNSELDKENLLNVAVIMKLAQLELKIEKLTKQLGRKQNIHRKLR